MDRPRCRTCGSPLGPPSLSSGRCEYCGAVLGPPPATRWRWFAHRPSGVAGPRPPVRRAPYAGPPRYRFLPRWGFPPSVWIPEHHPPAAAEPASPVRELRSVVLLARATGVVALLAAAAEAFRFVLLVRGRTQVLPAGQVRWSDALVVAAGWGALLLGLATAVALVPALARTAAWAAYRAGVRPPRTTAQRLVALLVPGWNLYGAGAVVSEIDAMLRMPPPASPEPARPDRLRWLSAHLPDVPPLDTTSRAAPPEAASDVGAGTAPPTPLHRSPHRLVSWWWALWALGGVLALAVVVWTLRADSLQARANLVQLHVVVDLLAAACAFLTAAVARSWARLVQPAEQTWPAGWILSPLDDGLPREPVRA
jgi:hypothetical protein